MKCKAGKAAVICLGLYFSLKMTAASLIDTTIPVEAIYQSSELDLDYLKFRHLMKAIRGYVAQLSHLESEKNQQKLYKHAAGEIIKAVEKAQDYQRNGIQGDVLKYVRGALMRAQQNLFALPLNAFWIDAFWTQVRCVLDWVREVEPTMIREQIALLKTDINRLGQEKEKIDRLARQEWEEGQKSSWNDEGLHDSEGKNSEEFYYRAQKRHLNSMIKDRKSKMKKLEALASQVG